MSRTCTSICISFFIPLFTDIKVTLELLWCWGELTKLELISSPSILTVAQTSSLTSPWVSEASSHLPLPSSWMLWRIHGRIIFRLTKRRGGLNAPCKLIPLCLYTLAINHFSRNSWSLPPLILYIAVELACGRANSTWIYYSIQGVIQDCKG